MTVWEEILHELRAHLPEEDFRRWFGATAYASDAGDQITVWVPSEAIRRHIVNHYTETVQRSVRAMGRANTTIRFVVGGTDEDEDADDDGAE
jgi:chromosomal replication initiation ATPase DnaA